MGDARARGFLRDPTWAMRRPRAIHRYRVRHDFAVRIVACSGVPGFRLTRWCPVMPWRMGLSRLPYLPPFLSPGGSTASVDVARRVAEAAAVDLDYGPGELSVAYGGGTMDLEVAVLYSVGRSFVRCYVYRFRITGQIVATYTAEKMP